MWSNPGVMLDLSDLVLQERMRSRFPGKTPEAQLNSRLLERDRAEAGSGVAGHDRRLPGFASPGRRIASIVAGFRRMATGAADSRAKTDAR
ncbi:MAG: hypothetical protein ACYDA6_08550 [Solirubrobacteraceae bacterium]